MTKISKKNLKKVAGGITLDEAIKEELKSQHVLPGSTPTVNPNGSFSFINENHQVVIVTRDEKGGWKFEIDC